MNEEAVYRARLEVVDFLVEVFWDVPREEFLMGLFGDEFQVPDDEVNERMDRGFDRLGRFVDANRDRPVETVADELNREFTRLFVGPRPPVLPHETAVREDADYGGEGLAEVQAAYSAAGWSSPEEYPEEDDYLAVELAFVRDLIERQRAGHDETFGFERVFLDEHLLTWHEPFLEAVRDAVEADDDLDPEADLFLAAVEVFAGFVVFEDELVAQQVPGA